MPSSVPRVLVLLCLVLVGAAPARAQVEDRPFSLSVLGGGSLPISNAGDRMGFGWNVGVAGAARVYGGLQIRADYLYDRFGADEAPIDVGLGPMLPAFKEVQVRSKSQMHFVSADLVWLGGNPAGTRVYVMAGPTLSRRRVQLTAGDMTGITAACEPQWLQCSPEAIGFDRWLGIKESDDFGFNAGVGVALRTGLNARLIVEARYYHLFGPTFTAADGAARSASASFLPVSVGLRF